MTMIALSVPQKKRKQVPMSSIFRSTGVVAVSTFFSRILGFVRDMLFASYFGTTGTTDAFFTAFRIPNLFRRFVAEGALTISFVPVYADYCVIKGEGEALRLAQKTLTLLLLVLAVIISLGMVFSSEIVSVLAYGFDDPEQIELTVRLTRIMFPYLFFVSFVAFSMGILNTHRYFFAPAFAPVLLNVGMITGIVFLGLFFKVPLYGVAAGVIAGGVLQLILQIPYLVKTGFKMKISLDLKHPGIRRIFTLLFPLLMVMGITQINNFINSTFLASMLEKGSISYIYYSNRLTELVLGIFIVSIGNVILPEMSRLSSVENLDKVRDLYASSVRAALFLAIPASVALIVIGIPIISVLFMRDSFTPFSAQMTYKALLYESLGIFSVSILRITTPTFSSLKDTRSLMYTTAVNFIINVTLGYNLMQTGLAHGGLTLAPSISVTVQVILLTWLLQRKIGKLPLGEIARSVGKIFLAAGIMGAIIWYITGQVNWFADPFLTRLGVLAGTVAAGGAAYLGICYLLKVEEVIYFMNKMARFIKIS